MERTSLPLRPMTFCPYTQQLRPQEEAQRAHECRRGRISIFSRRDVIMKSIATSICLLAASLSRVGSAGESFINHTNTTPPNPLDYSYTD